MSRIGKLPIEIPAGVTVSMENDVITVTGPKGTLTQPILSDIKIDQTDGVITVTRKDDEKIAKAQHGLMRTLIHNMVVGVTEGFSKQLEVNGVGYKVNTSGQTLKLALGYSHEVVYKVPETLSVSNEANKITISGTDKQQVGQIAAEIRALRKPEPYKGKGIKYVDEYIVRKAGKAAGSK